MIKKLYAQYTVWFKVAALVGALGFGVWLGFRLDPDTDCGLLDSEIAAELATLRVANAEYEEADKLRAEVAAKKEAEDAEREKQDALELKAARLKAVALEKRLRANDVARKAAKEDPKCAELMELKLCETIPLP